MCDFKPGDEVVCVDARCDDLDPKAYKLTEGAVYLVGVVGIRDDGQAAVAFRTIPSDTNPGKGYAFCVRRFRKVQKRNSSLSIESFLTIKPGFEEPKRAPAKKGVDA